MTRKTIAPKAQRDSDRPFDGTARTVDQLIDRLDVLYAERDAILDELRRQKIRATDYLQEK